MIARCLTALTSRSLRLLANSCGFLLVFAAVGGVVHAVPPPLGSPVPEIDPGSLKSVLALLGGGALLLTERLRRK